MRVLCITPRYPPEGSGMARYAQGIAAGLAARGHAVAVLACTGAPSVEVRDGVTIRRLAPRMHVASAPVHLAFGRDVRNAILSHEPDVVVVHTPAPHAAGVASHVAQRMDVPVVVTHHSGEVGRTWPLRPLVRASFDRRVLRHTAALVAVSSFVQDHVLRRHQERVHVILPGVDTELFAPADTAVRPEILFVGPLTRAGAWKGVDLLWAAFQEVARKVPEARLVLVGDGNRRAEFEQRARVASGRVRVVGRMPDRALAQHYRRCTVLALPSVSEAQGFATVLAEANACGRPVVASRIGGIPGFVTDGDNGLLVEPGDAQSLARALVRLLRDADVADAMGRRGRDKVLREHRWCDKARSTEGALDAAIRRTRSAST